MGLELAMYGPNPTRVYAKLEGPHEWYRMGSWDVTSAAQRERMVFDGKDVAAEVTLADYVVTMSADPVRPCKVFEWAEMAFEVTFGAQGEAKPQSNGESLAPEPLLTQGAVTGIAPDGSAGGTQQAPEAAAPPCPEIAAPTGPGGQPVNAPAPAKATAPPGRPSERQLGDDENVAEADGVTGYLLHVRDDQGPLADRELVLKRPGNPADWAALRVGRPTDAITFLLAPPAPAESDWHIVYARTVERGHLETLAAENWRADVRVVDFEIGPSSDPLKPQPVFNWVKVHVVASYVEDVQKAG